MAEAKEGASRRTAPAWPNGAAEARGMRSGRLPTGAAERLPGLLEPAAPDLAGVFVEFPRALGRLYQNQLLCHVTRMTGG